MHNATNRKQDQVFIAGFRLIFMRQTCSHHASGAGHITEERKCRDSGLCFTLTKKKNIGQDRIRELSFHPKGYDKCVIYLGWFCNATKQVLKSHCSRSPEALWNVKPVDILILEISHILPNLECLWPYLRRNYHISSSAQRARICWI